MKQQFNINDTKSSNEVCGIWESKKNKIDECLSQVIVIVVKERGGSSAVWSAQQCGLPNKNIVQWDVEEAAQEVVILL